MCSFDGVVFPWLFMFVKACLLSSHLKKQLSSPIFTDWLWETNTSVSLVRDSEAFSELFYAPTCSTLLVPSCDRIPEFAFLLSVLQGQARADSPPFFPPSMMLNVQVSSQAHRVRPALCTCSLFICKDAPAVTGAHPGSQPWSGGLRGEVCEVVLVLVGQWQNLQAKSPQGLLDGLPDGDGDMVVGPESL